MTPLSLLVDQLLSDKNHTWQIKLRSQWTTLMGDLSRRARLERINGTTLVIGVYDTHWIHELHSLSRIIVQRINSALADSYPPGFTLTSVRCIWVNKKETRKAAIVGDNAVPRIVKPTAQVLNRVKKISSLDLQDALLAYYIRCRQA